MTRLRRDVGIGSLLTAAFLAVAFLTLTSGIIGLLGFWQASIAARTLVENTEMIRTVQEIRVTVSPLLRPAGDFILTGDPSAAVRYAAVLDQVVASIDTYQQAHQAHSHSAKHRHSAELLVAMTEADIRELSRLGDALFVAADSQEALALMDEMEALLAGVNGRLNELLANAEEDIRSAQDAHAASQYSAYIGLAASALLAFSLAVGLAFSFTRSISRPLTKLADAADRITSGDLSTPIEVEGHAIIL